MMKTTSANEKTPLSIEILAISQMPKGVSVTRLGLEPKTPTLKVWCSTDWASESTSKQLSLGLTTTFYAVPVTKSGAKVELFYELANFFRQFFWNSCVFMQKLLYPFILDHTQMLVRTALLLINRKKGQKSLHDECNCGEYAKTALLLCEMC